MKGEQHMSKIKCLVVNTDGQMTVEEPDDFGLEYLRGKVGGWIEAIGDRASWSAYLNEEGKLDGLPVNPMADQLAQQLGWQYLPGDFLVGNVVFCGPPDGAGEDTSVPDFVLAESVLVRAMFAMREEQ